MTLLAGSLGCAVYRNIVDPCYPERYNYVAQQEVRAAFIPQVENGHILDQTVWNYHFEPGTPKLTPGGQEHLARLARTRPTPDLNMFVQTALDVPYDCKAPEKYVELRNKLNNERVLAVQTFLTAYSAGTPLVFHVAVHDPAAVGMAAPPQSAAVIQSWAAAQGRLTAAGAGGGR
jgi:hypothetical protein